MKSVDLVSHGHRLARASASKSRQVDLKRAVSAGYYAMFHTLARECADVIVGVGAERNNEAWLQAYRALEHGFAKNACQHAKNRGFPVEIVKFATTFAAMQQERHSADYDPTSVFGRSEVTSLLTDTSKAIADFHLAPRPERRAFVALVLLREPRR